MGLPCLTHKKLAETLPSSQRLIGRSMETLEYLYVSCYRSHWRWFGQWYAVVYVRSMVVRGVEVLLLWYARSYSSSSHLCLLDACVNLDMNVDRRDWHRKRPRKICRVVCCLTVVMRRGEDEGIECWMMDIVHNPIRLSKNKRRHTKDTTIWKRTVDG